MGIKKWFGRGKRKQSPPLPTKQPDVVTSADAQISQSNQEGAHSSAPHNTKDSTIDQTSISASLERSEDPQLRVISPKMENVPIRQLWNVAYETLREEDAALIEEYENKLQGSVVAGLSENLQSKVNIQERMWAILQRRMDDVNKTKLKFGSSKVTVEDVSKLLLNVVNSANSFISQAVSASPPASIAWAGVSFLLPLFMNISAQSIALAEGLAYISSFIAQSQMREELYNKRYELRIGNHEDFQQSHHEYKAALERLYRQILKFQAKSCCYYSNTSAFRHTLDAVKWNSWDQLVNDVREREKSFIAIEGLWRDMQHLEERLATESTESKKEREELLKWLCNIDHSSLYNTARERHEAGTNEWLVKHSEEFKTWETTGRSLLWLHGKAGSGKSVLSSSVISYLKEKYTSKRSTVVAYFYYSFSDINKQTTSVMLASLIKQIYSRQTDLRLIKHLEDYKIRGERPDTKTLEATLLASLSGLSGVFIVIDGLDECPLLGNQRQTLLRTLSSIFSEANAPKNLHVFMTSRKEQDIDLKIRALLSLPARLEIDLLARQKTLDNDICQYINSTLATDNFISWKDDVKEEVRQSLIKKADSMFQYVRFQLEILQETSSPTEIREALLDLPVGLDATYDRILDNINAKFRNRVINSLKWLAFSRNVLSIEQLSEIFIINPNDNIAFDEEMRLSSPMDVLKYFSGLVISSRNILHKTEIRLAHFSVKEYLTSSRIEKRPTSAFSFTEINAHEHIVRSCLAYLAHLGTIVGKISGFNSWDMEKSYPLIRYMTANWALHLEEIPRESWSAKVSHEARLALATRSQRLLIQLNMEYTSSDSICMLMKPYCYTAQRGFLQLTETLLSQELGGNKYLTQEDLDSGLQHAAYGGNTDIAQLFLEAGAKVSVYYGKTKWYSALHAAASGSHPNILAFLIEYGGADFNSYTSLLPLVSRGDTKSFKFLLDHGVNIDAQDKHQQTALHWAIRDGDTERISLLLDKGANVNALSGIVGTPLHVACTLRNPQLYISPNIGYIQMLLRHGADPNIRAGEYATALQTLCYTGLHNDFIVHKEIETILIPLLIKHGADVSAQGGKYGTALHAAAAASQYTEHAIPVMRLLLTCNNGAKVDQPGGDIWGTALQLACSEGTMEAVRFLLNHGADVNAQGGSRFGTPLQAAAWRDTKAQSKIRPSLTPRNKIRDNFTLQNKIQILELLLSKGARVNQQGGEWGSALQAACRCPHVEVLRLLLDHGADVNASGGMNGPALTIACSVNEFNEMAQSRECIQLLLDCGAHINAQSEENGTALAAACGVCFRDVERVQLLLSYGADVNAQGGKYGTALMAACQEGEDRYDQQRTAACRGEDRYGQLRTALYRGEDGRCIDFYSQGSVPVAQLLLDRGAEVNAQGGIHGTALLAACSWSHSELVQLLLKYGADIHLQDCAAWHEAARRAVFHCGGDMALLALLNHGMHINHIHQEYGTALHAIMAEYEFAPEGTNRYESYGASFKHGRFYKNAAGGENWRRSIDILINHVIDTSIVSERLGSALHVACARKLDEVHIKSSHRYRNSCANIDCTSGKTKYLLEQVPGIDVNVRGGIFGSPLQAAAYSGQALSVKMLLDRKASVNVRGGKYRSALNGAIIGDHWDIVEVLLEAGATPDCDLEEEPDEEWLQTVLKEEGRGAVERYMKFWNVEMEKKS